MEDINNLLNSGEVPNLLKKDDARQAQSHNDGCHERGRESLTRMPMPTSSRESGLTFTSCLAMSPVGEKLRNRLRMFPSLVNCCTIDWINPWPEDALCCLSQRCHLRLYSSKGNSALFRVPYLPLSIALPQT